MIHIFRQCPISQIVRDKVLFNKNKSFAHLFLHKSSSSEPNSWDMQAKELSLEWELYFRKQLYFDKLNVSYHEIFPYGMLYNNKTSEIEFYYDYDKMHKDIVKLFNM